MSKIAIMQPTFNPWLGYFELIHSVDKFIFLDTVELTKRSWQTRNRVKNQNRELMITLPIKKSSSSDKVLIKDALLNSQHNDFKIKLIKTLEHSYKKSKFYSEVHSFISELILYTTDSLSSYNINIIKKISAKIGIETDFITLSEEEFKTHNTKGLLILDICKEFKCKHYISPIGSKDYLRNVAKEFEQEFIHVKFQEYQHPVYKQIGDTFLPYMGIFDLLYNEGFERSLEIILFNSSTQKVSSVE